MPKALPLIDVTGPVCCAPLGTTSPDPVLDAEALAARLRALGDSNRIRLVQELACCEGHHLATTDAARLLGVAEATANHHLKRLAAAGIVRPERAGQRVEYVLNLDSMRALSSVLNVACGASCACC